MTDPAPFLIFRSAGRPFALPVGAVREVAKMAPLRRLPTAPSWVAGLIDLRGELITVLNLPGIGIAPGLRPGRPSSTAIMVIESGGELLGIMLDESPDIQMVSRRALSPPPATTGIPAVAVVNLGADLPLLLDPDRLTPAEEDPVDA